MENFIDSIRPAFDEILTFVSDFEQLRDPLSVRTKYQDNISIEILAVEASDDGRTVRVTVVDPDSSDPFNPLGRTSVGWILIDDEDNEFIVNEVHKLSNAFTVTGNVLPVIGNATLRPSVLIDLLASDYGIEVDQHDPEAFQRSAVKNVFQWLSLKGVERAYDIIGKISGYRVTAEGLWKLSSIPDQIPLNRRYELPVGSGDYYTDLEPNRAFLDEIPADMIPLDSFCWETPDWTTENIEPPFGPLADDVLVSDAISYSLQNLNIYSTTDLGDGYWKIVIDRIQGSGDNINGLAPTMYLFDSAGLFYSNMVGNKIEISGATSSGNNGTFYITEYLSPDRIGVYNPDGVAEVFSGTWTFDSCVDEKVISVGRWYLNFPSGDSGDFFTEEMPVSISNNRYEVVVLAGDSPMFGSTVDINYQCHIDGACDFCRASAVRVEITPEEILSDPEALLDNALERMINKIRKVIPIHVRIQNLIHMLGPVDANVAVAGSHIYASPSLQSDFFTYAPIGYYFDIVPADELEVDPSHLAATATQYTIP